MPQGQLEDTLYAFGAEIESNTVEVYVSRLRKKLGRDVDRHGARPRLLDGYVMARPRQLTRQLILTLTIGTVVLWTAAAGVATVQLRAELDESFDSALRQTAQRLLTLAAEQLHEAEEDAKTAKTATRFRPSTTARARAT